MNKPIACYDPDHEGNSSAHHTGKPCVERGCTEPAGTAWSPLWCVTHNMERMRHVDRGFESLRSKPQAGGKP